MMQKSICKWPNDLVIASGSTWHHTPHMASFGPYHYGEPHLQPMEHHKKRALYRIVQRRKAPVSSFVDSLRYVEQELKGSYDNLDANLPSDSFLKMMLLDGCFMLELLFVANENPDGSEPYDPVFTQNAMLAVTIIQQDMLMLENQIPLLVLRRLLGVKAGSEIDDDADLNDLIIRLYGFERSTIINDGPSLHILDIYRKCLIWESPQEEQTCEGFLKSVGLQWLHLAGKMLEYILLAIPFLLFRLLRRQRLELGFVRSAMRFHEAGIHFKKWKHYNGLKFHFNGKNGMLTLPYIEINDFTAAIYMNLMSFERMNPKACPDQTVTSYVAFMDDLIDTADDVSLLSSRGIVNNILGSEEEAAKIFNKLGDGIIYCPDYQLHHQLQTYAASDWNAAKAYLMHNYFKNPWSILSLTAAIVLLALTFIQTWFTVSSAKKGN